MKTTRQPLLAALLVCGLTMPLATVLSTPVKAYTYDKEYSREDIAKMIVKAKKQSKKFRKMYESAEKQGNLPADDNAKLKTLVQSTDEWLEKLNTEFNKENDWQTVKPTVTEIVSKARSIDQLIAGSTVLKDKFQTGWTQVRSELNGLADAYELRPIS